MNEELLANCITTESFTPSRQVTEYIEDLLDLDLTEPEKILTTCLDCEVRAFWVTASGVAPESLYLPPDKGYIKVRLGEIISLSLTAEEAMDLLQQVKDHGSGEQKKYQTKKTIFAELENAWSICVGDVEISVSQDTADNLAKALASVLP